MYISFKENKLENTLTENFNDKRDTLSQKPSF